MSPKAPHTHNRKEVRFVHRLAASLSESHGAFVKFCFGRDRDSDSNHTQPPAADELAMWQVFVEETVFPLNSETAKLIDEHRHLYEELPSELVDFMEYHTSWLARHTAWKTDPMQPYSFCADRSFPLSVNTWVLQQLRDLMQQYLIWV
jgi:hypothetical protein